MTLLLSFYIPDSSTCFNDLPTRMKDMVTAFRAFVAAV